MPTLHDSCSTSRSDLSSRRSWQPKIEALMKTRKRTLSQANSSSVIAQEVDRESPCSAVAPMLLKGLGHALEPIPHSTADTLAVAIKAFQAQLGVLNKQPPMNRHAGFTQFASKHRLEFRIGDKALGQLGLLQSIAVTVQFLYNMPHASTATCSVCILTGNCAFRWCKRWMTLQEACWKA